MSSGEGDRLSWFAWDSPGFSMESPKSLGTPAPSTPRPWQTGLIGPLTYQSSGVLAWLPRTLGLWWPVGRDA